MGKPFFLPRSRPAQGFSVSAYVPNMCTFAAWMKIANEIITRPHKIDLNEPIRSILGPFPLKQDSQGDPKNMKIPMSVITEIKHVTSDFPKQRESEDGPEYAHENQRKKISLDLICENRSFSLVQDQLKAFL